MNLKFENKGETMVCRIDGDVDINTSPSIKKLFDKALAKKAAKMVVNLQGVNYVDSSGLATLVEILKNMRQYGGKLKLSNLSPKIKSLFDITKLDKLFEIASDEEEAIASFI